jgi:serine/threonine protein kinase
MPLSQGQVLNRRYRIVRLLGQGGFGAVYRAWDTALSHPCALKENLDTSSDAQRQFEREALMLAGTSHPNLPRVTDHFSIPAQGQYLVMDFVEGQDLLTILEQEGGPLAEAGVLAWIGQICDALTYLHSQNPPIIHRDIKPANIRITPEGRAMLVDFGIAKVYDPHLKTTVGARAVTPGYSPPEQYGQGSTDARTDIYALGATLYHLLTGQKSTESIQRTLGAPLTRPAALNPGLSAGVERAVLRAMELMPEQRFQSAAQFKRALTSPSSSPQPFMRTAQMPVAQPTLAALPVSAPPAMATPNLAHLPVPAGSLPAPRPFPWIWIGVAAALVLVVLCGVALSSSSRKSNISSGSLDSNDRQGTATALAWGALQITGTPTRTEPPHPVSDTPRQVSNTPRGITEAPRDTDTPTPTRTRQPPSDTPTSALAPGMTEVSSTDGMTLIYIGSFWIDRTEVTNAMYALCVRAGACSPPAESSSNTRPDYFGNSSYASYPVVKVDYDQARKYCSWAGRRLPTGSEWARAAGGNSGSRYPWGNSIDCNHANIKIGDAFCVGDTSAVGSYPAGATSLGVLDMAGNVFEWVADKCDQGYVVRGGCWNDGPDYAEISQTFCRTANSVSSKLGFRCAR